VKPAALGATLLLHTAALGSIYHFNTTAPAAYAGQATYTVALLSGGHPSAPTPIDPLPSATQASSARTDAPLSENLSFLATTLEQAVQLLIEAETDVKDDDLRHRIDVFLKKE
jgi:hypothetical protein